MQSCVNFFLKLYLGSMLKKNARPVMNHGYFFALLKAYPLDLANATKLPEATKPMRTMSKINPMIISIRVIKIL